MTDTDRDETAVDNAMATAAGTPGAIARVDGNKLAKPLSHLVAGGLAGLVSAITLQPFDLLKTRLQQQQRLNQQYRTTITKELRKLTRIKELWRGALPSALRTSVGAGLYFTLLSMSREYLASLKRSTESSTSSTLILPRLLAYENLITGFGMRALVGFVTMPITVIKTRYELNAYSYNSMYEGVEGIYLDDGHTGKGSVRNFFRGSIATLARDCPYAGLYVLFYELFKNDVMPSLVGEEERGALDFAAFVLRLTLINSSSAVLAASVATTLTAPFDAVKTRLQLSVQQISIWQATRNIILERGGVANLFRGLSLRLSRKGLSAGISWCVYEELIKANFMANFMARRTDL